MKKGPLAWGFPFDATHQLNFHYHFAFSLVLISHGIVIPTKKGIRLRPHGTIISLEIKDPTNCFLL